MEIRKLTYRDSPDVVDLFESLSFQAYGGHGSTMGAARVRNFVQDEVKWETHDFYGFFFNGQLDCIDILSDNPMMPLRVSNSFVRFGERKPYLDTGFDKHLKLLLDHTFRAEEVTSGLPRVTMEMTELKGKKKATYHEVFDSVSAMYYRRGCLQRLEAKKKYSYLAEEYPLFYRQFLDLRPKHPAGIERCIFIYYKNDEVIA